VQDISRFDQVGRARGTLPIGGKSISLADDAWWGTSRTAPGAPPSAAHRHHGLKRTTFAPFLFSWSVAQFPATRSMGFRERAPGNTVTSAANESFHSPKKMILLDARKNPTGNPLGCVRSGTDAQGGASRCISKNGEKREVHSSRFAPRWTQGRRLWRLPRLVSPAITKGEYYCEHDVWDLSDPAVVAEASSSADHLIEWTSGNDVGFGIMERLGPGYTNIRTFSISRLSEVWPTLI